LYPAALIKRKHTSHNFDAAIRILGDALRLRTFMTRVALRSLVPALLAGLLVATPASAQMDEAELVMRLNRLESQLRTLTGQVEQLQYRNQQLEQQLARGGQQMPERPVAAQQPHQPLPPPPPQSSRAGIPQQQLPPLQQQGYPQPQQAYPQQAPAYPQGSGGRRGDAFDPNANPNAPGAPRTLGNPGTIAAAPPLGQASDEPQVGAPGGRQAGEPLDLGVMAEEAANGPPPRGAVRQIPGALPPPPPRNTSATGAQQMVMAPSNTPKDEYDLAYGYVLRKDYALAEDSLRGFIRKYPNDRLVADANYWLGETMFQRQKYREAAETFLDVSTKHEKSAKAPESLLRLGQSLAALKEKEAACATLGEIPRKYPRVAANVKQSVEREQKRVGCL
jgi:tol-pal system protein YbgF